MDQSSLKMETIITANEYIKVLIDGTSKTVQLFREGNEKEALNYIQDILEGLQWLYDALTLTQDIHKQNLNIEGINPLLNEMHSSLKNEDYTLLADLLEFEILPHLCQWESKLDQITGSDFKNH